MNLINNWKSMWKFWSIQLNALGILILSFAEIINQAWVALPPTLSSKMPHAQSIAIVVFGLGILARLINQDKSNVEEKSS